MGLDIFIAALLLAFGTYQSILYFGHTIIPNPDFMAFIQTGKEILSLQIPSSFNRAPVLGVLQALLSHIVDGPHPELTAGWLLNAILHPFNLLLLWLVGREIVGKAAVWVAIIAIINPWTVYLLTEPIVETTLLFFVLLTLLLLLKHSKWAYLLASITTMVRYEGAALILAAFVMDMIFSENRRQRVLALILSVAASVPLVVWLIGTVLTQQPGSVHYVDRIFPSGSHQLFAELAKDRTGMLVNADMLWRTGFRPLLFTDRQAGDCFVAVLWKLSKSLACISFVFGAAYGLYRRQWKLLPLLIFFVLYFAIHAAYPYPIPRYQATVFWIGLLICLFGLQSIWGLIDKDNRLPRSVIFILQALLLVIAVVWLFHIVPDVSEISAFSPRSTSIPYVASGVVVLVVAGQLFLRRRTYALRELSILALMCLVVVSNQSFLAQTVRDGRRNEEFKLLGEWFVENAHPGEKLAVYMAGPTKIYASKYADAVLYPPKAEDFPQFVEKCRELDIDYLVWASREGLRKDHEYYRLANLERNMAALGKPRDVGPFKFLTQLGSKKGFVHIFRLLEESEQKTKEETGN
jgi:hypothetical protein